MKRGHVTGNRKGSWHDQAWYREEEQRNIEAVERTWAQRPAQPQAQQREPQQAA